MLCTNEYWLSINSTSNNANTEFVSLIMASYCDTQARELTCTLESQWGATMDMLRVRPLPPPFPRLLLCWGRSQSSDSLVMSFSSDTPPVMSPAMIAFSQLYFLLRVFILTLQTQLNLNRSILISCYLQLPNKFIWENTDGRSRESAMCHFKITTQAS